MKKGGVADGQNLRCSPFRPPEPRSQVKNPAGLTSKQSRNNGLRLYCFCHQARAKAYKRDNNGESDAEPWSISPVRLELIAGRASNLQLDPFFLTSGSGGDNPRLEWAVACPSVDGDQEK